MEKKDSVENHLFGFFGWKKSLSLQLLSINLGPGQGGRGGFRGGGGGRPPPQAFDPLPT